MTISAMSDARELRVGVRELRGNLTRYLNEVRQGTPVLVTSRGVVVAEIRAPGRSTRRERQFGRLKGRIRMADDFIELPDDILDAMES